jgi:O-antigen/teichoic acid export membrane protein
VNVAKTVLKNVAASWVGLASQILVTFLLTPFVIEKLGTEAYGVWLLLQGLVGYYGLMDLGLQAGMTQSITRRIASNDIAAVRRHISAAVPTLCGFASVVLVAGILVALLLPRFVDMSPELASVAWLVVLTQAIGAAVKMPITPFGAVLVGLQRYDVANAISILTRIVFALSTWWVLWAGGGLVGLSLVLTLTNLLDSAIRVMVARRMLPGIQGTRFSFNRAELKEIANVGGWNFVIGASRQFIYFSDSLTVGLLFSARAVAPYGIAASFVELGNKIVVSATKVLFPTMTHLSKSGNLSAQRELYIVATRLTLGVSFTILVLGSAWISPFLKLWLGQSEENRLIHIEAPLIFAVLATAFACVGFQRAGIQLLLANDRLRLLAILMGIEAVLNLIFSFSFGWFLGPIGVAIGTLIPAFALGMFVHVPLHARALNMSYLNLIYRVLLRPLSFLLLMSLAIAAIKWSFPTPTSWESLFLVAGVLSPAIALLLFPMLPSSAQLSSVVGALRKKFRGRTAVKTVG